MGALVLAHAEALAPAPALEIGEGIIAGLLEQLLTEALESGACAAAAGGCAALDTALAGSADGLWCASELVLDDGSAGEMGEKSGRLGSNAVLNVGGMWRAAGVLADGAADKEG